MRHCVDIVKTKQHRTFKNVKLYQKGNHNKIYQAASSSEVKQVISESLSDSCLSLVLKTFELRDSPQIGTFYWPLEAQKFYFIGFLSPKFSSLKTNMTFSKSLSFPEI